MCRFEWWFVPLSFALLIFVYDHFRKAIIRRWPGGWCDNLCSQVTHALFVLQVGWREKHYIEILFYDAYCNSYIEYAVVHNYIIKHQGV